MVINNYKSFRSIKTPYGDDTQDLLISITIHLKVLLGMKESADQSLKLSIRKPVLPAMALLFSLLGA